MLSAQLRPATKRTVTKLHRSIATAHGKTHYTSLTNGLTIATEANPSARSTTLGLYFGAGSTSENPYNNGVSNLLNRVVVNPNSAEATKAGLIFGAQTSRDHVGYYTQGLQKSLPEALELLNAKVNKLDISDNVFLKEQQKALKDLEYFEENDHENRVLEHLHATAFQNTPLALPTRGTVESVADLAASDLVTFAKKNYVSSNAVVVATGDVDHNQVVELVEKTLQIPTGEAPKIATPKFLGSEVRLRDDTLPHAYVSIAHKGEALNSKNYYVAKVAAQIFGSFNYNEPLSKLQGVKLLDVVNETHLADSFKHFSLSYKDSGLWGFNVKISNIMQIDDFVHFTLKEWNRLSVSITNTEVERAKQVLKNQLLSELSSPLLTANDIGCKVLAQGRRPSAGEIFTKIDKVDVNAVKAWANENLWDQDIAIAGTGQIESLLDYARIRADTSMMRW